MELRPCCLSQNRGTGIELIVMVDIGERPQFRDQGVEPRRLLGENAHPGFELARLSG